MMPFFLASTPSLLFALVLGPTSVPTVFTPAPGSLDRKAILTVLHHGDARPKARFQIRNFRVVRTGARAIAYVQGQGEVGAFHAILTQDARISWREVWGEGDGGSNSCDTGARHYAWAVRLIRTYKIDPDRLFPGVAARAQRLKQMAADDPEVQCVGDLEGGPGG